MFEIELGPHVLNALVKHIETVLLRQWREALEHFVPLGPWLLTEAFTPLLSGSESEAPVSQLKSGVHRRGGIGVFRDEMKRRAKNVAICFLIEERIGGEE